MVLRKHEPDVYIWNPFKLQGIFLVKWMWINIYLGINLLIKFNLALAFSYFMEACMVRS